MISYVLYHHLLTPRCFSKKLLYVEMLLGGRVRPLKHVFGDFHPERGRAAVVSVGHMFGPVYVRLALSLKAAPAPAYGYVPSSSFISSPAPQAGTML